MIDDERTEHEVEQIRGVLMHEVVPPAGMMSRLEAGVRREVQLRRRTSWEIRVAIGCLCFACFAAWSADAMSPALTIVLGVLALAYPWAALGKRDVSSPEP